MSPATEERLLDALDALAEGVHPSAHAYERTQAEWRRRERRRRRRTIALAVVIIAIADVIGLWALNGARSGSPVVFDGPAPVRVERAAPADCAPSGGPVSGRDLARRGACR